MFVMYKACFYPVKVLDLGWELEPFQCRLLHPVFFVVKFLADAFQ